MFADEELVMELLINAGQARSDAMEAIRCATVKNWEGVTQFMASSESAGLKAHKIQTALISQDEGSGKIHVNLKSAPASYLASAQPARHAEPVTKPDGERVHNDRAAIVTKHWRK